MSIGERRRPSSSTGQLTDEDDPDRPSVAAVRVYLSNASRIRAQALINRSRQADSPSVVCYYVDVDYSDRRRVFRSGLLRFRWESRTFLRGSTIVGPAHYGAAVRGTPHLETGKPRDLILAMFNFKSGSPAWVRSTSGEREIVLRALDTRRRNHRWAGKLF